MSVALRWLGKQRGRISLGLCAVGWVGSIFSTGLMALVLPMAWGALWADFWGTLAPSVGRDQLSKFVMTEARLLQITCPQWEPTEDWFHMQCDRWEAGVAHSLKVHTVAQVALLVLMVVLNVLAHIVYRTLTGK